MIRGTCSEPVIPDAINRRAKPETWCEPRKWFCERIAVRSQLHFPLPQRTTIMYTDFDTLPETYDDAVIEMLESGFDPEA